MAHPHGIGAVKPVDWAYDRAPMILYWELTQACGLACRHCRATAQVDPAPGELSTAEAIAVLDQIAGFGDPLPHLIMTGGDPLRRRDLGELIAAAGERGLGVSVAPAVTPLLTRARLAELVTLQVQAISLSLDGATAANHDGLRQIPGTFVATLAALADANAVGLPVQVNTLVTDQTVDDLDAIHDLLLDHEVMQWSLFFLISVGRGAALQELDPGAAERTLTKWSQRGRSAPFRIKTTEAPQYRRIVAQRLLRAGQSRAEIERGPAARGFGIRDGNGVAFISHRGDLMPSGFLPIAVGNLRERTVVELYRESELLRALRNPESFKGRCGVCEFNRWCGGSRARAHAWTGDPLESDPLCPYQPAALRHGPTGDAD